MRYGDNRGVEVEEMRKIVMLLLAMGLMGCSTPVKPECPVVPKCPDSYAEAYIEEQRAADRLEDALREANEGSQACVRVFEDYQRKSSR
jgi:hypothetical protein